MNDKPTYDEFNHSKIRNQKLGYFVRAADNRIFAIENGIVTHKISSVLSGVLVVAFLICFKFVIENDWPIMLFDNVLFPIIFSALSTRLLFYFARFRELDIDSEEYSAVRDEKYGKPFNRLFFILSSLALLFLFLNSYSFACLRSLIYNEAQITKAMFQSEHIPFDNAEALTELYLSPDEEDCNLTIHTICTPALATITVDGYTIKSRSFKSFSFFWDSDYFWQEIFKNISRDIIHDGSVIAFDCGTIHREWVIKLTEGEGA